VASEVVTRNWGARCDSIATVEPDVARDEGGQDLGSVLVSTNNARSSSETIKVSGNEWHGNFCKSLRGKVISTKRGLPARKVRA
jgi:hypothetical protein